MNSPFHITEPNCKKVPVILSVPHCGIDFPEQLRAHYQPDLLKKLDDTDWFVDVLYDFAEELGITKISAKFSRWVIDLNRDPENSPLYSDGRIITGLIPTTDFFGNNLYVDEKYHPDQKEIETRLENYYWHYYQKLESLIQERIDEFGRVLLWDAHSIRQHIPTISKEPFPDLILGDNDEKSAGKDIIDIALSELRKGKYQVNHNAPFKGGHITRYFGKPEQNVHALQLEMTKIHYMNDDELTFNETKANEIRSVLRLVFENLISNLMK